MAIEPRPVITHDNSEIAPTFAMFVGSMMIPEPIMLTATMNVSWVNVIFFRSSTSVSSTLFTYGVRVELDASVYPFLKDPLHFVVEAGELIERFLEREEVIEHRLRPIVPAFAGNDDADAWRVDQREGGGNAPFDLVQRHVVDVVADERLIRPLR